MNSDVDENGPMRTAAQDADVAAARDSAAARAAGDADAAGITVLPRCGWLYAVGRSALIAFLCVSVSVTALLMWGRLRLVTSVPRTALADPESRNSAAGPAGDAAAARPPDAARERDDPDRFQGGRN